MEGGSSWRESVWGEAWGGEVWVAGAQVASCRAGRCSEKKPGEGAVLPPSSGEEGVESAVEGQGTPACRGAWETVGVAGTGSERRGSERASAGGTA